jgi:hypothetical protein
MGSCEKRPAALNPFGQPASASIILAGQTACRDPPSALRREAERIADRGWRIQDLSIQQHRF